MPSSVNRHVPEVDNVYSKNAWHGSNILNYTAEPKCPALLFSIAAWREFCCQICSSDSFLSCLLYALTFLNEKTIVLFSNWLLFNIKTRLLEKFSTPVVKIPETVGYMKIFPHRPSNWLHLFEDFTKSLIKPSSIFSGVLLNPFVPFHKPFFCSSTLNVFL